MFCLEIGYRTLKSSDLSPCSILNCTFVVLIPCLQTHPNMILFVVGCSGLYIDNIKIYIYTQIYDIQIDRQADRQIDRQTAIYIYISPYIPIYPFILTYISWKSAPLFWVSPGQRSAGQAKTERLQKRIKAWSPSGASYGSCMGWEMGVPHHILYR